MALSHESAGAVEKAGCFATTHWSVVLAAGQGSQISAEKALDRLCQMYWYPLYAYVRRCGRSPHDAQDLTQSFFARVLETDFLERADKLKGRFRSYLLTSLKHFLSDEYHRERAVKRGGGQSFISMDNEAAEERYRLEPVEEMDAEKIFERRWALTLLEKTLEQLEKEYQETGKGALLDSLRNFLLGDKGETTYGDAAKTLSMTEGAVKVAVHRMRRRYRELFCAEISSTVANPDEIEDELRHLFVIISR
jgi:RNA polymerase sigma factor (sigma-70 family)